MLQFPPNFAMLTAVENAYYYYVGNPFRRKWAMIPIELAHFELIARMFTYRVN